MRWKGHASIATCLLAGGLLFSAGVAWAVVPPDLSVKVTDETGEPIPDITITVEVPRKAKKKPRRLTKKLPKRPRRNHIDRTAKRIVKRPPRRRDTTATFRIPRDANCNRPLKVKVRMGKRTIARRMVQDWCDLRNRRLDLALAPSPFYARDLGGDDAPGEEE